MADILHRDVSIGNILINTDTQAKEGDRGILIDLDYAVRMENLQRGPKMVVCGFSFVMGCVAYLIVQGTRRFMSRNILQSRLSHSYLDDLESFYYVLCWLICEYDGPGDVSASRVEKTPKQLKDLDSKDGAKKSEHMRNEFELPIRPWFGEIIREMAMHLHSFFHRRTRFDAPTWDPGQDYEEFIGHIRHAIERLGPEHDVDSAARAEPVSGIGLDVPLTNGLKRNRAEIVAPDEPNRKPFATSLHCAFHVVPERPRRAKARYQTPMQLPARKRRK